MRGYAMNEDECPGPHRITIDWSNVSPYILPDNIESAGGCYEGSIPTAYGTDMRLPYVVSLGAWDSGPSSDWFGRVR